MDDVMIVCGMIVIICAVLYSIVQGLRRGPKLPAVVLLSSVILAVAAGVVHDVMGTESESLRTVMGRLMLVFVPVALGAYAHALRSRSGL